MAVARCRLELMGLPDAAAYRQLSRRLLPKGAGLFSGFNIPNKKPGEPLLEWASVLLEELPDSDVCVHYSLKHQRGQEPVAAFRQFCGDVAAVGGRSVLLVTGPRGPAKDAVAVLEAMRGQHPAPGWLRLGVAFNACLPTEKERARERDRLLRKLRTGLVEEVWLNTGSDTELLAAGAAFVKQAAASEGANIRLYGSALLPNPAQLQQMNERPWNGVHFSEHYLSSLKGMTECTREVLATFRAEDVEPIIESKVRNDGDLASLRKLLEAPAAESRLASPLAPPAPPAQQQQPKQQQWASKRTNRWRQAVVAKGPPKSPGVPLTALKEGLGLKDVPRTGWVREGVEAPESVAAHSWGVAFLATQLCPESLDRGRVLEMAVVHDLAEVRVGDITPDDGVSPEDKHRRETEALGAMGVTRRTLELFAEYEAEETDEARFVKLLDKLDMALQSERYEEGAPGGRRDLSKFRRAAAELAPAFGLGHLVGA